MKEAARLSLSSNFSIQKREHTDVCVAKVLHWLPSILHRVPNILHRVPNIPHWVPNIPHWVPNIHPSEGVRQQRTGVHGSCGVVCPSRAFARRGRPGAEERRGRPQSCQAASQLEVPLVEQCWSENETCIHRHAAFSAGFQECAVGGGGLGPGKKNFFWSRWFYPRFFNSFMDKVCSLIKSQHRQKLNNWITRTLIHDSTHDLNDKLQIMQVLFPPCTKRQSHRLCICDCMCTGCLLGKNTVGRRTRKDSL